MVKIQHNSIKVNKAGRHNKSVNKRSVNNSSLNNRKKKIVLAMPWSVLIWSLALFHVMNCCDWALAGERNENSVVSDQSEEMDLNYGVGNGNVYVDDFPLYEWSPYRPPLVHSLLQGSEGSKWQLSPMLPKGKRAAYGILGLATKRPHKTASEIQHLPPQDSFMSVRGKKKRSVLTSIAPFFSSSASPLALLRRAVSVSPPRIYLHPGKQRKLTNGESGRFFHSGSLKSTFT